MSHPAPAAVESKLGTNVLTRPQCSACADTGEEDVAPEEDVAEDAAKPIEPKLQWNSPWLRATASVTRQSDSSRPARATHSGNTATMVATRATGAGVFPPAKRCETAANIVANAANQAPRATRETRSIRVCCTALIISRSTERSVATVLFAPRRSAASAKQIEFTLVSETQPNPNPITPEAAESAVTAALNAFAAASSVAELKAARTEHAGEASALAQLNSRMREVPTEEKAATGKFMGKARGSVENAFAERERALAAAEASARLVAETVDVTEAPVRVRIGSRHPLALLQDHISDVFIAMGWEIEDGPEVEHEWFNFDALGFDPDHPARAMQDTFFVEPADRHLLLRTHTSPVQIRAMLSRELPVYALVPGRVYRTDELDATHTPVFHQIEGVAIDRGLTMAHLRGTLEHFARQMFGAAAKIRLRPNFFPFTEPSAELDVWQPNAKGGARWVEWGGCGMVDPRVLAAVGIDSDEFQGFAFGMGVERTLQFRHDINDMRDMVEGDVRFNAQFGGLV
jgi:phenylalanyl-tRNA synthetase alpha chain